MIRPRPSRSKVGALGKVLREVVREIRKLGKVVAHPVSRSKSPIQRPRLGLALGGGFARGVAHVGVLKVLLENQIPIDALAGTSAGSIAAAAFASGCTIEEMIEAARNLRWNRMARWTIPRLGFASNERMQPLLSKLFHCQTFEQLKLPLAVVAADIRTGEAVVFREGDLIMPVRASCSFPGLFVPIEHDGHLLVDGVLAGSVPVTALRGVDVVVAVNVRCNSSRERPTSLFEIVGESFQFVQNLSQPAWRNQCDLVIEPELNGCGWDEFHRADELIAAGEAAARKALPALRKLLRERARQSATAPEKPVPPALILSPALKPLTSDE